MYVYYFTINSVKVYVYTFNTILSKVYFTLEKDEAMREFTQNKDAMKTILEAASGISLTTEAA